MLHKGIPAQCEMHNVIMCVAEAGGPHDTTCLERGAQQARGYRMMYEFPFCEDRETVVAGLAFRVPRRKLGLTFPPAKALNDHAVSDNKFQASLIVACVFDGVTRRDGGVIS